MFGEEYPRKRLRDCADLRAADHDPELGRISGVVGLSFGRQFDYIWCIRCGNRQVPWLRRWFGLSLQKRCPGAPRRSR